MTELKGVIIFARGRINVNVNNDNCISVNRRYRHPVEAPAISFGSYDKWPFQETDDGNVGMCVA